MSGPRTTDLRNVVPRFTAENRKANLAFVTAISITRPGGAVGRVGVPQEQTIPNAQPSFFANITIAGGPAPVRAYMAELLPDVLEGRIEPGRVFDRVTSLDGVPEGYRAMNAREAIKVVIEF